MRQAYVNFFRNQRPKELFGRGKRFHFRHFAALMLAVLMILSSIPAGYAADTPRRAVITVMEGSVLVQAADQATAVPARKGMELKSGDRIITGKDGSCTIRYDDGCTTHIGPNSRVDMANLTRQGADGPDTTILNSQRGTLWNNAKDVMARNSRFEVNTPSAVAAVRGTFFKSIVLPNGDTLFIVLGGGLYISPAGSDEDDGVSPSDGGVFVGGGQQLGVSSGEELPDSAAPLDYDEVDDTTLLYLAQDNPDIFVDLIESAAAQGETEFLERVNQILEDNEDMQENLGDKLETVQQTVTQGTSQPPATPGGDDPDDIYYTLTVNVRPDGSGTVTGGGSYAPETPVTLKAIKAVGYEFVNWTIDGTVVSDKPDYTYTMPAKNVTVTANFESTIPSPFQLIVAPYVLPWNYEGWFFFIEASEAETWQKDESLLIRVMQPPAGPGIPPQPAMIGDQPVEPEICEQFKDQIYFQLPEGLEEGAYVIQVTPAGEPQNVIAAGVFHVVELEGNGVPGDPYIVETPEELDLVRYFLDAHFELGADIDLDVAPYNASPGWVPIGNGEAFFSGTFNGNGKTISNLYINRPEEFNIGLFGVIGVVEVANEIANVNLADVNIIGKGNVGSLVGKSFEGSIITRCSATGSITGDYTVGGLVGCFEGEQISDTYAAGTVSGQNQVGGLVGTCGGGLISYNFALNPQIVRLNDAPLYGNEDFGRIVGSLSGEPLLQYNYARYDMGEPFVDAYWCYYANGDDLYYWSFNEESALPLIGATGQIYAGETYQVVEIVIVGDTFDVEAVEDEINWDISVDDSALSVLEIVKDEGEGERIVYIYFEGIVEPDTVIEIQALAGALSGETDSNVISVGPMWLNVGAPGFSEGMADYIDLKVGDYGPPYVAYSSDDQIYVQKYEEGEGWDDLEFSGNGDEVSDISLYVEYPDRPYVAYNDSSNVYVKVRDWMYGWQSIGSDPIVSAATDISLYVYDDAPYLAYATQSGEENPSVVECVYNPDCGDGEWQRYPIVYEPDPEVTDNVTSVSLFVAYVDGKPTPYVAYYYFENEDNHREVSVKRYNYGEGWFNPHGDLITTYDATDVSLYVNNDYWHTPYVAFREDNTDSAIHVKSGFDGWHDVVGSYPNNEDISVSSAGSLSFVGIPVDIPDYDHPLLFVAYKDLADGGKAKVKGYVPHFSDYGIEGSRWVNIGGAVSEDVADSISITGFCYIDEGMEKCKLFVAFKDSDDKITVKEFDFIVGPAPQ